MTLQAVIFDLDGLMADSEPLAEWAWGQVLARFGHALDPETVREMLGMRVVDSARFVCRRFSLPISPEEAMAERDRLFLEMVPTRLRACPGLEALLDELDRRGLPLAVATSGHRPYVALALETLGVADRFRVVVSGDDVTRGKPAPDIYLLAAERLGLAPVCCLALEDALLGVESARAAGMTCVVVPNRRMAASSFPADCRVLASLDEVREALDGLLADGRCAALADRLKWYSAAGGVVVRDGRVLALRRPSRDEVRLPKGHIEPGEDARTAALREVREESGCSGLQVREDLGAQLVEFEHAGRHVVRTEWYFLMTAEGLPANGETQFEPVWLAWDEVLAALTFEAEREWVRRAKAASLELQKVAP